MSNLLIYQSSAGSGKTYKLAKEYLKLAFKFPGAFKYILAITFTNKATEEMKSRILKFLSELSLDKNDDLKSQLIEEGVEGNIKELAKSTLSKILHNYTDFSVSTIDSFFNSVLRSFSRELRLQMGFEIELDQKEVLKNITGTLLKDLSKDEELRNYIEEFILHKISEDRGWDIEKDIMKLGEEIFKERYWEKKFQLVESGSKSEISDSRKRIRVLLKDIQNITKTFEDDLKKTGDEAENIMKKYDLSIEDFANKDRGVGGFLIYKIRDKKDFEINSYVRKAYASVDGWYKKTSGKKEIILQALDNGLYCLLKKAVEYIQTNSVKYNSAKEIKNNLYTLGIFEDLIANLNEYRKTNRKLLQTDVNNILYGLISSDNSAFVYEKIGSNYKNLLIDEFQDTSTFQWKNLLPLIINVLSEKYLALVVGDIKQSIYRWRSGNMKLLLTQIYEDLYEFRELLKTEFLKTNRRSGKEIVEFNNKFFIKAVEEITKDIAEENIKNMLLKAYSPEIVEQDYKKEGGYISINFFDDVDKENPPQARAEAKVPEIIKEVLSDGYMLSDILILVRRNSEVRAISELLTGADYKIISTESLLVNNSPKVRVIVDLIKFIADNKNKIAKADALYNYIEYIKKDRTIYNSIFENTDEEFIKNIPQRFFKENEAPKIKPVLNDLPVYEVCENLVQILEFDKISDPYIIKFQNTVLKYSQENNADLVSFLDWWEEKKNDFSIDTPAHTNAISIMTVHKAKGLQGKVVIVPYANWKINIDGTKDLIWVSTPEEPFNKSAAYPVKAIKNLANTYFRDDFNYEFIQTRLDNLNLLYVTFTRAEERLYVLVPEIRNTENAGKLLKNVLMNYEGYKENKFESGKKDKAKKEEDVKGIRTENLKHYISSEWYKKIVISPKHIRLNEFIDKDFTFKTNWGVIGQQILSRMKTKDDIEKAINKVFSEGIIPGAQKEKVRNQVNKILNNKDVKNWFNDKWDVKSETGILLNDGSSLRPCRVITKDGEAIVIDYKTGIEQEYHKNQLKQYAEKLTGMGFSKVSKYLLYLNSDDASKIKIVEVN